MASAADTAVKVGDWRFVKLVAPDGSRKVCRALVCSLEGERAIIAVPPTAVVDSDGSWLTTGDAHDDVITTKSGVQTALHTIDMRSLSALPPKGHVEDFGHQAQPVLREVLAKLFGGELDPKLADTESDGLLENVAMAKQIRELKETARALQEGAAMIGPARETQPSPVQMPKKKSGNINLSILLWV